MNKNLKILIISLLGIPAFFLIVFLALHTVKTIIFIPGVASTILIFVFSSIVLAAGISWENSGIYLIIISSFTAMFLDAMGNPFLNIPFKLFLRSPQESFKIIHDIEQFAGSTSVSYHFLIVKQTGQVIRVIHPIWIYSIRYLEYLIIFSFLMTILVMAKNRSKSYLRKSSGFSELT